MSRRSALVVALILNLTLGGLAFTLVPAVSAATFTVCAMGCDHTTIQSAVTAASPGDTISVAAGIYQEQVRITKNLTLTGAGAGRTTIQAPPVMTDQDATFGGFVIAIVRTESNAVVTMSGFTIAGPVGVDPLTFPLTIRYGVFVGGGSNLNLSASTITGIVPNANPGGGNGIGVGFGTGIGVGRGAVGTAGTATLSDLNINFYEK